MIEPLELFRLLADGTRLRAVYLMHSAGELCVCELTGALDASQPKISRHLAQMREAGLVLDRRAGQWVHYRINPDLPAWVQRVIGETCQGLAALSPFLEDGKKLRAYCGGTTQRRCA